MLEDINTIFFCDETKFSKKDHDPEDAIYYVAIMTDKSQAKTLKDQYFEIIKKFNLQGGFHASKTLKRNDSKDIMISFTNLIVQNGLRCFCFKYNKSMLFDLTKRHLGKFTNDIHNFNNSEHQALFYFVTTLISFFLDNPQFKIGNAAMFFDRNFHGIQDVETMLITKKLPVKHLTFTPRDKLTLLALPDYVGYIFRMLKLSINKVQLGNKALEISPLVINASQNMLAIKDASLFHYIDISNWTYEFVNTYLK